MASIDKKVFDSTTRTWKVISVPVVVAPAIVPETTATSETTVSVVTFPSRAAIESGGKADAITLCTAAFGAPPPKSWSVMKMAALLHGIPPCGGAYTKAAMGIHYKRMHGVSPTKSWSTQKVATAIISGKAPGGAAGKASAVAAYTEKMGVPPTKSWSGRTILAKMAADKLPGTKSSSSKGGVTCVQLKAWLKDHNVAKRSYATKKEDMLALLTANNICVLTGVKLNAVALIAA